MNTKKKIAFATAAALAMFGISAVASAAPLTVTVNSVANVTTSAAPQSVAVPSTNVIDAGHTVAITATADTGTVVAFTGSSTVKLVSALNSALTPVTIANGVSSISAISTGVAVTVYAYTTSTNVGSVTIVNGAYSTIAFIKGTAGSASNVAVSVPTSAAINTAPSISVSATDVFGNAVGGESILVTLIGGTFSDGSIAKPLVTATAVDVLSDSTLILGSKSATLAVLTNTNPLTVVASDASIGSAVTGLSVPVKSVSATLSGADLLAQIAALKADVAKYIAEKNAALDDVAKAVSAKAVADALIVSTKAASDKALTDANTAAVADYNKLVARYNSLAMSYAGKAKKYKFSTNITLAQTK
jgi:hypothetical protein